MGRFISGSSGVEQGYTRAEVFTSPGTSSWSVPAGVSKAKVFVIGAGSNYRNTEFCFESSSACCSGVATPGTEYCLNFVGHLVGAGGGYAEKTFDGVAPGSSMTINIGSVGGLSASSASIGGATVTANNATDTTVSWNCTSNSTARDNTLDNEVSLGFDLPVCGYRNCINGYFNAGGTAAGGDINRTGGAGVFIPYFREDSEVDGSLTSNYTDTGTVSSSVGEGCTQTYWTARGYDYTFGGCRCNCTCTRAYLKPTQGINSNQCGCCFYWGGESNFNCLCMVTYHNVFGGRCYYNMPWSQCICQRMCNGVYLCVSGGGGGSSSGVTNFAKSAGGGAGGQMYPSNDDTFQVTNCPVGIGSEAGSSHADGYNGVSDATLLTPSAGGGGSASGTSDTTVCYIGFGQDHFSFIYGSGACGACAAMENLYGGGGGGALYYSLGYSKDIDSNRPSSNSIIPLSTMKSRDGTNVADFKFGFGATSKEAAGAGGGGNRLYPTGGSGAVVVVY